ncbi:MAG: hypothetical protein AAF487_05355 [Bacteroidota bacterium]
MENYLRIEHSDNHNAVFQLKEKGKIEFCKLTKELTILRFYFEEINLTTTTYSDGYIDDRVVIMLANYPTHFTSFHELDKQEILIKNGWDNDRMFTMIGIWDGEQIDNNVIHFQMIDENNVMIRWTGEANMEGHYERISFVGIAKLAVDVVTPLCESGEKLIEIYS